MTIVKGITTIFAIIAEKSTIKLTLILLTIAKLMPLRSLDAKIIIIS